MRALGWVEKQVISSQALGQNPAWGRTVVSAYDDAGRRTGFQYPVNGSPGSGDFVLGYQYDVLVSKEPRSREGAPRERRWARRH